MPNERCRLSTDLCVIWYVHGQGKDLTDKRTNYWFPEKHKGIKISIWMRDKNLPRNPPLYYLCGFVGSPLLSKKARKRIYKKQLLVCTRQLAPEQRGKQFQPRVGPADEVVINWLSLILYLGCQRSTWPSPRHWRSLICEYTHAILNSSRIGRSSGAFWDASRLPFG